MAARPLWRRAFDHIERRAAGPLESLVQTSGFADALAVWVRLDRAGRRRFEETSRRVLHFWNLPAGTDVKRLREQLGRLEHELRDLSKRIEDLDTERE